MDRYKYSVTPFSPIKELIPGKSIRAPFVADLNKDEVFLCMKHGPVFRLFPGTGIPLSDGRVNESQEQWMRLDRPALEFRMKLNAYVKLMIRKFHGLHQIAVRRKAA